MTAEISDVQAAVNAGLIRDALTPIDIAPGAVYERIAPSGWLRHVASAESLLDNPRRTVGTVMTRTADGFKNAVLQRAGDQPVTLYSDEVNAHLVAVLNDDDNNQAGWRDHRVELSVRTTPEWAHWVQKQGLRGQVEFAEAIEAGLDEIRTPTPADMLRIAETFEANINVKFAQGEQLRDGARQITFEEEVKAKAGGGSMEIPESMLLNIAPYIGGPKYEIVARVRFRIREQKLTIGYDLVRPHEVEAAAFRDTVALILGELSDIVVIEGVAPAPRTPTAALV